MLKKRWQLQLMVKICRFIFINIQKFSDINVNIVKKVLWDVPVGGWKNM